MEDQKKNSLLDDDLSLEELAKNFDNIDTNEFFYKQLILLNYANSRLYKFLKDQIFCKPATDMNPILTVSYILNI